MRGIRGKTVLIVILIVTGSFTLMTGSTASKIPPWTFSLEIEFDETEYNASLSRDPITFHGWVNWTGYSVREINVQIFATCSLNDVYPSQYDFTFHTPKSSPFTGFIPIPDDLNSTRPAQMIITGTITHGATQSTLPASQADFVVRFWEPEENKESVSFGSPSNTNYPLVFGLPSLLLFFLVLLYFKKQRLIELINIMSDKIL